MEWGVPARNVQGFGSMDYPANHKELVEASAASDFVMVDVTGFDPFDGSHSFLIDESLDCSEQGVFERLGFDVVLDGYDVRIWFVHFASPTSTYSRILRLNDGMCASVTEPPAAAIALVAWSIPAK